MMTFDLQDQATQAGINVSLPKLAFGNTADTAHLIRADWLLLSSAQATAETLPESKK